LLVVVCWHKSFASGQDCWLLVISYWTYDLWPAACR